MLRVRVHACGPGRVSDGFARDWQCTKLSLSSALLVSFSDMLCIFCYCFFLLVVFVLFYSFVVCNLFCCSRWSFVDVPLIFFFPADHVLGMVEARSVN